ncbi:MAG TPA: SAM-dependent methyltransferase [Candidatus Margulisbacteria bacterium]|nr:MAG: methyltransferase type 11 [Candidatus Margulisbacteria bacterium GWD2_39_127]HAR62783.1 SAM-dependent methyltransferase [Candidatus Margulisiibacteriota bacterium]
MKVFHDYARYYNLLYKDKNYYAEVDYVDSLIKRYKQDCRNILDLGCGTGIHAKLLTGKGYCVHGIDQSEQMISLAKENNIGSSSDFSKGDIRSLELDNTFDVITALFHVISYQVANNDLINTFAGISKHLATEGICIFDVWYGPAVLTERPELRTKIFEDDLLHITRIANPVIYPNDNIVDVNYEIIALDKSTQESERTFETHRMRYLFKPELELFLRLNNLKILAVEEWLTGKVPGFDTWGVSFVAQKQK